MLDDWYRNLHIPMSPEQFHLLPRHAAYKYEYVSGQAWLTPRPRTFNALLDLKPRPDVEPLAIGEPVEFRTLAEPDWLKLPKLFAAAFERVPPFIMLGAVERLHVATECLRQTRAGGDGPLLETASFVAEAGAPAKIVAAILITLIPRRDEGDWWDGRWESLPATDEARRLLGRPHLTWVFVAPGLAQHGLGSALLDRSVSALRGLGYADLGSTFLLGNDGTTLWHWRNGFRLLPYAGSLRREHK